MLIRVAYGTNRKHWWFLYYLFNVFIYFIKIKMPFDNWFFPFASAVIFWFVIFYIPLFHIVFSEKRCKKVTFKLNDAIDKLKNHLPAKAHIH